MLAAAGLAGVALARPAAVRYRVWQGRRALAERDAEPALSWLKKAERLDPEWGETQFFMARAYRHLGQFDRMRACLVRAAELGYPGETLKREETLILAQAGRLAPNDPALTALMIDPRGDSREIYEAVVPGFLEAFHVAPALALIDAWQADFPDDPEPYFYSGMIEAHELKWAEAAASFQKALQLAPRRFDIRLQWARALREGYRYREALRQYRACLAREESPEALFGTAKCLERVGETDEARKTYLRLLDHAPDHYEALLALGKLDFSLSEAKQAVQWLEPAAKLKPYEFEVRHALAWALLVSGEKDRAREQFEYAVKAQETLHRLRGLTRQAEARPDDAELRYQIGAILLESGQTADALAWLQSALQLQPDHRPTHRLLADYYARQGKEEMAARHRRMAGGND